MSASIAVMNLRSRPTLTVPVPDVSGDSHAPLLTRLGFAVHTCINTSAAAVAVMFYNILLITQVHLLGLETSDEEEEEM